MTQENETVWLGIDWADEKHRWAMRIQGEARTQHGELEHTPEAVEGFISSLAIRFPGQRVAVALEQSRGALIFMLSKYEHLILYPIHPNTLDHYRKSVYPSGAKSDPADATLILEFLCKHSERLRPFHPDTEETRTLQLLVEARREAVDDKTRYLNRLCATVSEYHFRSAARRCPHLTRMFAGGKGIYRQEWRSRVPVAVSFILRVADDPPSIEADSVNRTLRALAEI